MIRHSALPARRVYREYALCDGAGQHEVQIWYDGTVGYACGEETDCGTLLLDGRLGLFASCNQPGRDEEPCCGKVEWSLAGNRWHPAEPSEIVLLDGHGERPEQED